MNKRKIMKYKSPLFVDVHPKSFVSNFWGALHVGIEVCVLLIRESLR